MMNTLYWLLAAVSAYILFGLSSLGDKLVLAGDAQKTSRKDVQPKAYTFYVGLSSIVAVLLIPFVKPNFPGTTGLLWIIADAIVHILGLYTMYVAVKKYDVSRVIATIGATQPIFIFILTWFFWGPQPLSFAYILAFIILFLGSAIISIEKNIELTGDYLKLTIISSIMFSFDYIFAKFVFLNQSFLPGIIWIEMFIFLFVLFFLFSKSARAEIFSKQAVQNKKTQLIFLSTQLCGGAGNFMQAFAISLAPVAFLAIVNSMRGIQYIFLFIITLFISYFYPKILEEEISRKIFFQKIISIILIAVGLIILAVY